MFKEAFELYCLGLPYDSLVAPIAHVVMMESVQALILDKRLDFTPSSSDFKAAFADIPTVTIKWKEELDQSLCRLIGDKRHEDLDLATSLFDCIHCSASNISYQRVLAHAHIEFSTRSPSYLYSEEVRECLVQLECWPVQPDHFRLADQRYIRLILQACNLPEESTTMGELEQLDPLLWCQVPQGQCGMWEHPGRFHAASWHAFVGSYIVLYESANVKFDS
jgi:hypothetical protein